MWLGKSWEDYLVGSINGSTGLSTQATFMVLCYLVWVNLNHHHTSRIPMETPSLWNLCSRPLALPTVGTECATLRAATLTKIFGRSKLSIFDAMAERMNKEGDKGVMETTTGSQVMTGSKATTGRATRRKATNGQVTTDGGAGTVMGNATEGPGGQYATPPGPVLALMGLLHDVTWRQLGGWIEFCEPEPRI